MTKPKEELFYSPGVLQWCVSCDRSSQETLEITLFYRPGRLVKISWKSLDISSTDMSGCRFWVDFREKFAFNWAKCWSNHCNYLCCLEKRVTLYNYSKAPSLAPCCKPAAWWSLYGSVSPVRMVTVGVSQSGGQMSAVIKCNTGTDGSQKYQRQSRLLYGFTWVHKATIPGFPGVSWRCSSF